MIRKVLGVDPGLATAAAAVFGYERGCNLPTILGVFDIPTKNEGPAKRINGRAFGEWVMRMSPDIAYIENASTMPAPPDAKGHRARMNAAHIGRYMRAAGAIETTVDLCGVDIVMTQPATWKRTVGLITRDKNGSLDLIRALYPEVANRWFKLQKHNHRAEATLIAIHGAVRCDLISLQVTS